MEPGRRICVVTGSRAEYGLLRLLMRAIADDETLVLQVAVTGMHLVPEFGETWREIAADGFTIDHRIEMLVAGDTPSSIARSVGLGVIGFTDAFTVLGPDIVVVLGDRFEILSAVQAAFLLGIPIAHISGGEVTLGALDDSIRHAITKFSRWHFVAAETYLRRVVQLGETPEDVFDVGDPALDNIRELELLDVEALGTMIGLDLNRDFLLVTFHPETSERTDPIRACGALVEALDTLPDLAVVLTRANADAGGRGINEFLQSWADARSDRARLVSSLGSRAFLSALRHCGAVVGNSSAGIVEAPALGKPTVNIGTRQEGRLMASSILSCPVDPDAIAAAIRQALTPAFRRRASETVSLYGDGDASRRIKSILASIPCTNLPPKAFRDA